MTMAAGTRLAVIAFSVAAVQATLIDRADGGPFRHLDLPLAAAIAVVATRPADKAFTGFVFGLAVDLFQLKLFGLHGLAYCAIGPVAVHLPVSALRRRWEAVALLAAAQTLAVSVVVGAGVWLIDRRSPGGESIGGIAWQLCQAMAWSAMLVVPLTGLLGGRIGPTITPAWGMRSEAAHPADRR